MELPWKNPELIRHLRRELRPVRLGIAVGLPVVLCVLVMLVMREGERDAHRVIHWDEYWRDLYIGLLIVQGLVLAIWCTSTCGQAISSERQLRTFDFLRTTRLDSGELLAGTIFGRPLVAYVMVGVLLPFTLLAGTASGQPWWKPLASIALIWLVCLCFAIAATLFSLLTEKPRIGELIALLLGYLWLMVLLARDAAFLGWNTAAPALAVIPSLENLNGHDGYPRPDTYFFHLQIAPALMTAILYSSFAAWLVLMLVRNFKRDRDEVRLLARWQALALIVYINLVYLAQVRFAPMPSSFLSFQEKITSTEWLQHQVTGITSSFVVLNAAVLYIVGTTMLVPAGNLKAWFREKGKTIARYWEEDALSVPWMIAAGACTWAVLAAVALAYQKRVPVADWSLGWTAVRLTIILVYALRDTLFLQWCSVTRMKSSLVKGTLLLGLYYFAACMVVAILQAATGRSDDVTGYAFVTPIGAFLNDKLMASMQGAGVQVGLIVLLVLTIRRRFVRSHAVASVLSA